LSIINFSSYSSIVSYGDQKYSVEFVHSNVIHYGLEKSIFQTITN